MIRLGLFRDLGLMYALPRDREAYFLGMEGTARRAYSLSLKSEKIAEKVITKHCSLQQLDPQPARYAIFNLSSRTQGSILGL